MKAFTLSEFPPVSPERWRERVEQDLRGASFEARLIHQTYDAISRLPLYHRPQLPVQPGLPAGAPYLRGGRAEAQSWELRSFHPNPKSKELSADLKGGVDSLELEIRSDTKLEPLLEGIGCPIALNAGPAFEAAAAKLIQLKRSRRESLEGAFNADPLAFYFQQGRLPYSLKGGLKRAAELARFCHEELPEVRALGVNTGVYHRRGASEAQDLGLALASGLSYLRAMEREGMSPAAGAPQLLFRFDLGTEFFLEIARLRAARRLWGRVMELCGVENPSMQIQTKTARRSLSRRDPWINLLRNTVSCFAAALGGAEIITPLPFDAALGEADALAQRMARNTSLLLRDEAHLAQVLDPAGGAWAVEQLSEELSQAGWAFFQQIEARGGLPEALPWVHDQLEATWATRLERLATRQDPLTGISEFPHLGETPLSRKSLRPPEPWSTTQPSLPNFRARLEAAERLDLLSLMGSGTAAEGSPHPERRLAEPFEVLRDRSDRYLEEYGRRPKAFLATLGSLAQHSGRVGFSRNLLEAGGIEAIESSSFEESSAKIAVICGPDRLYPERVEALAAQLKEAGAQRILLAGRPKSYEMAWRAAGVDGFIYLGCDLLSTLDGLWEVWR